MATLRSSAGGGAARHTLILAVLAVAGTTFALLQAVVVPALPNIQHALQTTPSGAAWILTANLLSTAVLTQATINWGSAALVAVGLAGLLIAVSEATSWGWRSARTLGVLAGSAAVVAAWVRNELRSREPLVDMRMMAARAVWTTNVAAFLLGVGMYASIAVIPALVELPRSTGFGLGGTTIVAGLFMLPTATIQLAVGPYTGRIERRLGSRRQLQTAMACMLIAYAALFEAHATTLELLVPTVILGLGLGLGLSSLANLIVAAVRQEQTGVATGMNTVMRTLGGAFGAQLAVTCIAGSDRHGLPTDQGFTLAFGVCAAALIIGLLSAVVIPRARQRATRPPARGQSPVATMSVS